jgi:predicted phage baseplate assembly protein
LEVQETSLARFGITGRAIGLKLGQEDEQGELTGLKFTEDDRPAHFTVRETTVHVKSEELELAPSPMTKPLSAKEDELELDSLVLGLQVGQYVALTGVEPGPDGSTPSGVRRSEILQLRDVLHQDGLTTLQFTAGLRYSYVRDTATLNGNVVRATHGETVRGEVLGSGEARQVYQRFALTKPPLTHISAAAASGAASTLSVRVNGLEWQQAPSLYGLEGDSQRFIVRLDDEGRSTVIFGDGRSGARLPTGQENIVATYRSGIGAAGEVDADSLSLLKTRPLGIRSVTNPTPAAGSGEPERLEDARRNAPFTVRTLDRIVSLQDYEDFARAFAGIGKAQAVALWDGERQVVHITISGTGGDPIKEDTSLYQNLVAAIDAARDPLQELRVGSHQPLLFSVAAKVLIERAYRFEDVQAWIEAALIAAFSFERRAFGQPVTAAKVVRVMHGVDGVVAVDLDGLALSTGSDETPPTTLSTVLPAQTARPSPDGSGILPAQLLLINEFGITITEMTP